MKFGVHISTRKPFSDAVLRAKEISCEAMQIFANAPQRWNPTEISDLEIKRFRELNEKEKISPVIIHSIYLINLASQNSFYLRASIESLINDLEKSQRLGGFGVNTHLGSTKGGDIDEAIQKTANSIKIVLEKTSPEQHFIIENAAGAGNIIGDTLEEIGEIVRQVNSQRVKVLVDTAHAFASGYSLKTQEGLEQFIQKFEKEIGLDRLIGFHFNDSKVSLASKRDRHADIGFGYLGLEAFKNIINHPKLKNLFAILETPEDEIDWQAQLKILRQMEEK